MTSAEWKFVHVLALKLDPRWRRLPAESRLEGAGVFECVASMLFPQRIMSHQP